VFVQGRQLVALPPGVTTTRVLASLDPATTETRWDGRSSRALAQTFSFTVRHGTPGQVKQRIEMVPLSGGTRRVVVEPADQPLAALARRVVFVQNSALVVSEFDEAGARLVGQTSRFPEDVLLTGTGALAAAISRDGSILFAGSRLSMARLVWVDASGVEKVIPGPPRLYQNPRVSPDGRHIVFAANGTIWILDPERGGVTRVSSATNSGDLTMGFPVWSHRQHAGVLSHARWNYRAKSRWRGRATDIQGNRDLRIIHRRLRRMARRCCFFALRRKQPVTFFPYRPQVVTSRLCSPHRLMKERRRFQRTASGLTYVSNHSSTMEGYLRPLDGGDRRLPVSSGGGLHPLWSRDGSQIYYRSGQKLMAVDVVTTTPDVRLGTPRTVMEQRYEFGVNLTFPNYSLSHDGRQFLMVKGDNDNHHFSLVLDWLK
jgi:hypothetical protein